MQRLTADDKRLNKYLADIAAFVRAARLTG